MPKITAIVPTYNEIGNIKAVLAGLDWADEILVVDSYSDDGTAEIAKDIAHKFLQRDYEHSASQKNWAIPQATHSWIFLIDADERLSPKLKNELLEFQSKSEKELEAGPTAFWIKRRNFFMGKELRYSGLQNDKVVRLFKRDSCKYQDKRVHAEIKTNGRIGKLEGKLDHDTYKGMDRHIAKLNRYASWQAMDYDSKTGSLNLFHFMIKPQWKFFKHYIIQGGILDGIPGLVMSYMQAYATCMRYIKLYELRRNKS